MTSLQQSNELVCFKDRLLIFRLSAAPLKFIKLISYEAFFMLQLNSMTSIKRYKRHFYSHKIIVQPSFYILGSVEDTFNQN